MSKPAPSRTRDRIVEAAVHLFYEHGYAATGMAEILKKARANSGSFYFFFESKHDLLLAVLEWYQSHLQPVLIAPVCAETDDPIDRVFVLLGIYRANILRTDFAFGCPLGRLALEIDPLDKAHRDIAKNFDGWIGAVRAFLDAAANRLPRKLDRGQLACLVLSVMEGGVMQSRSQRSIQPFDDSVSQLREYFRRLETEAAAECAESRRGLTLAARADRKPSKSRKVSKSKNKEKHHG